MGPTKGADHVEKMSIPQYAMDELEENEALLMEPRADYDSCVVGLGYRFSSGALAVYDIDQVLRVLGEGGVDEEEAIEYFEFNVIGSWMGDGTPIFVRLFQEEAGC
jgi:hypothetical protein